VLPVTPATALNGSGFTVSFPEASVVLPVTPATALNGSGFTVSFPEASVVLPVTPDTALNGSGFTVSFPEVSVVLPVTPATALNGSGFTVSFPEASMVLPAVPAAALNGSGFTVSEPEVFVRLDIPPADPAGSVGSPAGVSGSGGGTADPASSPPALRLVELQLPPASDGGGPRPATAPRWLVVLEWSGSADARYVIEGSSDLTEWTPVPVGSFSAVEGGFRARCEGSRSAAFYRVRQVP
jgi:hypothetical protein